ncbi:metallophosphoesterase [Streptomyces phage Comrade]|uniref:Metallophosphoesterase n=1 Tax=Streptomyces phage Comrade TaxID=2301714 RepID=A0A385DXG2_9CAUD|nr:metallophosphoesterase [Streptomyces phage Comrade]AXQ63322.1 metallophosphoesterase [Streptomyces phage Comrade]
MKWAFISDLQIPYHDKRAVDLWFKAMKWWKPDAIDIPGDIDDQLEYSRFSDGTTDEFFNKLKKEKQLEEESDADFRARVSPLPFIAEYAKEARNFYSRVRNDHPNADVHVSLGNHDIRVMSYMDKKAPAYLDQITPNMLWGLDDLGFTYRNYELPPLERFGGVYVHHGNTTTTTGLAVKTDIENYNISLARGHDHRGGVVYKSYPMTGTTLVGLGTGHMCDPSAYGLKYTTNPSWELGFGIGHVIDGVPNLQFIPISPDYVCVVDGKVFKG